jgi:membrane-associated phospholipid phosphatase
MKTNAAADSTSRSTVPASSLASGYSRRTFMTRVLAAGAAANLPLLARAGNDADSAPIPNAAGHSHQRRQQAYKIRMEAALAEFQAPLPPHPDNGDEDNYPAFAPYSKGLKHNSYGEVDSASYKSYARALSTGKPSDFDAIVLGCTDPGHKVLDNPQAGLAFDLEGKDSHATYLPPAPAFSSNEEAGEIIEDYWMALARDIPFSAYDTSSLGAQAAAELSSMTDFRGPTVNGHVTQGTLFRGALRGSSRNAWQPIPGCLAGPYISQFLWLDVPFGADSYAQQMLTAAPGVDYMTDPAEWLNIQNACPPRFSQAFGSVRRYLCNGRDLGQWVHVDALHEAYFQAMLILLALGAKVNPGNPYNGSTTQRGFGTFGGPHIISLLPEVCTRALHAVWFQKWFVHRRLRPEEYGGRIHNALANGRNYPLPADLSRTAVLDLVHQQYGSYLLPMAYPEGGPLHPSYGSGHATVAGACVTILKAWFDGRQPIKDLVQPVIPKPDGSALDYYTGPDADKLTVEGELNKLGANIAMGRDFAGVHWRSDQMESLKLGEDVAISILSDQKRTYNERFSGFVFNRFDGTPVTV